MARINTNVASMIAQANLGRTSNEMNLRLERLSTGLKINRGKDDPAGLIISERIRSDIQGVNQGISNAQRASSVISTAEASLTEINDLLNSIRGLIVQSSNSGATSDAERDANQLQIDSAIDSITRISNTASFGGLKLLDGSLDYTLSGVRSSAITNARINGATFNGSSSVQVDIDVVASAQTGALYYSGGTTPPGVLLSAMTLEVKGPKGVQVFEFASGQSLTQVMNAINRSTALTGVQVAAINNDVNSGLVFQSTTFGSDSFVSVKRQNPPSESADSFVTYKFANNAPVPGAAPFDWATYVGAGTLTRSGDDNGQDVQALVNGNLIRGRGLELVTNIPSLAASITLGSDFATRPATATSTFHITGGGALFQLGPNVTALQQSNVGIPSVAASRLGGVITSNGVEFLNSLKEGQYNSVRQSFQRRDFSGAQEVLNAAIDQITSLRGRLGAFERNVLDTNVTSLQSQFENLTASVSQIRDADFAMETSQLTRAQILSSAGTSTLQLANQQSQSVLQLLGR
ncbi:MAG TPA: flagellin [Phycisphaerales bacterium]|nr:flagellin [Phycisphaerales bacterium]